MFDKRSEDITAIPALVANISAEEVADLIRWFNAIRARMAGKTTENGV